MTGHHWFEKEFIDKRAHSYLWKHRNCSYNNLPRNKKNSMIFITNVFAINLVSKGIFNIAPMIVGKTRNGEVLLVSIHWIYLATTAWCAISSFQKRDQTMWSFFWAFSATLMEPCESNSTSICSILDVYTQIGVLIIVAILDSNFDTWREYLYWFLLCFFNRNN